MSTAISGICAVLNRSDIAVANWIEDNLECGKVTNQGFMGSSSWSNAYRYDTESGQRYFVKEAHGQDATMFQGEALGLQAMHGTTARSRIYCNVLP